MSGEFDSRKDSQSTKFERWPRIFVKLSFRELCYPRKKMGVDHIQLEFLGLLFDPWKFWTKQSFSSLKNPAKLYDTYWE